MAATIVTAAGASRQQGPVGQDVNAEDVLDLITNITPWETPVVTMLPKVQATNTTHEWVVDSLTSPIANHNVPEGSDYGVGSTKDAYTARIRRKNYLQHFRYEVKVSNLQRIMNPFGVQDEYAYQVGKAAKACGYDIEYCILKDSFLDNTAGLRGDSADPAKMKKLTELISEEDTAVTPDATLINNIVDSTTMVGLTTTAATKIYDIAVAPVIAAQSNLTETKIMKMQEIILGSSVTGGGHPDTVICSPAVFGQWASFGQSTHLEILDALAAQDPTRCEQAMRIHLRNSMEYVKSII